MMETTNEVVTGEMEDDLRRRAASDRQDVVWCPALRYMASDYPDVVFTNADGLLRVSLGIGPRDPESQGEVSYASIDPYQPPSEQMVASVSIYRADDHTHRTGKLATYSKSEVCDTPEAAREWLSEQGTPLAELPEVRLEDYRHPENADPITVDLEDADIHRLYVEREDEDCWYLSKPHRPGAEPYRLDVSESPPVFIWQGNESERYAVRNFWRHTSE